MRKVVTVDLVKDLLTKANWVETKTKKRIIEWGDESNEEDEDLTGETSESKEEVDQDKKVFLEAFKSLNKDNMEHIPNYNDSLNGDELLDWLEAIDNQFD